MQEPNAFLGVKFPRVAKSPDEGDSLSKIQLAGKQDFA
jgi:hypothetical protein